MLLLAFRNDSLGRHNAKDTRTLYIHLTSVEKSRQILGYLDDRTFDQTHDNKVVWHVCVCARRHWSDVADLALVEC